MKHVVQRATVTIAAGALLAVGLAAAPATAAAPGQPVINEFSASTTAPTSSTSNCSVSPEPT